MSKDSDDYADAIELFLSEHPDGNVRKGVGRTSGHNYPKNRKSHKKSKINRQSTINDLVSSSDESDVGSSDDESNDDIPLSEIDVSDISDHDWSSSDEEM